jgi:hypothetical protein
MVGMNEEMKKMAWQEQLNGDTLSWLLEEDEPGVRYLALRDLVGLPADDPELISAQELAHSAGPISVILNQMDASGSWVEPGPGYMPKYHGTVWSVIMLAQLGASIAQDGRIERACEHLCKHAFTKFGQFSISGTPSGTVDCLQGNLCSAMLDLGFTDPRLETAFDWMARSVTGDGVAPREEKKAPLRYYSGKCGPGFCCGANNHLPCAWGAVKVMLAFGKLPKNRRTPLIENSIQRGIEFLLAIDPAEATYPTGWSDKPSGNWWKFGFPVFYVTDLLQTMEALLRLGYWEDPRLTNGLNFIREKQDENGRWPLEYSYTGKTWIDFGEKKQPNKWVTLRAAWILKNSQTPSG